MQEMIIQSKHKELAQLLAAKKAKIAVMKAKKMAMEEDSKNKNHKLKVEQN